MARARPVSDVGSFVTGTEPVVDGGFRTR